MSTQQKHSGDAAGDSSSPTAPYPQRPRQQQQQVPAQTDARHVDILVSSESGDSGTRVAGRLCEASIRMNENPSKSIPPTMSDSASLVSMTTATTVSGLPRWSAIDKNTPSGSAATSAPIVGSQTLSVSEIASHLSPTGERPISSTKDGHFPEANRKSIGPDTNDPNTKLPSLPPLGPKPVEGHRTTSGLKGELSAESHAQMQSRPPTANEKSVSACRTGSVDERQGRTLTGEDPTSPYGTSKTEGFEDTIGSPSQTTGTRFSSTGGACSFSNNSGSAGISTAQRSRGCLPATPPISSRPDDSSAAFQEEKMGNSLDHLKLSTAFTVDEGDSTSPAMSTRIPPAEESGQARQQRATGNEKASIRPSGQPENGLSNPMQTRNALHDAITAHVAESAVATTAPATAPTTTTVIASLNRRASDGSAMATDFATPHSGSSAAKTSGPRPDSARTEESRREFRRRLAEFNATSRVEEEKRRRKREMALSSGVSSSSSVAHGVTEGQHAHPPSESSSSFAQAQLDYDDNSPPPRQQTAKEDEEERNSRPTVTITSAGPRDAASANSRSVGATATAEHLPSRKSELQHLQIAQMRARHSSQQTDTTVKTTCDASQGRASPPSLPVHPTSNTTQAQLSVGGNIVQRGSCKSLAEATVPAVNTAEGNERAALNPESAPLRKSEIEDERNTKNTPSVDGGTDVRGASMKSSLLRAQITTDAVNRVAAPAAAENAPRTAKGSGGRDALEVYDEQMNDIRRRLDEERMMGRAYKRRYKEALSTLEVEKGKLRTIMDRLERLEDVLPIVYPAIFNESRNAATDDETAPKPATITLEEQRKVKDILSFEIQAGRQFLGEQDDDTVEEKTPLRKKSNPELRPEMLNAASRLGGNNLARGGDAPNAYNTKRASGEEGVEAADLPGHHGNDILEEYLRESASAAMLGSRTLAENSPDKPETTNETSAYVIRLEERLQEMNRALEREKGRTEQLIHQVELERKKREEELHEVYKQIVVDDPLGNKQASRSQQTAPALSNPAAKDAAMQAMEQVRALRPTATSAARTSESGSPLRSRAATKSADEPVHKVTAPAQRVAAVSSASPNTVISAPTSSAAFPTATSESQEDQHEFMNAVDQPKCASATNRIVRAKLKPQTYLKLEKNLATESEDTEVPPSKEQQQQSAAEKVEFSRGNSLAIASDELRQWRQQALKVRRTHLQGSEPIPSSSSSVDNPQKPNDIESPDEEKKTNDAAEAKNRSTESTSYF